MQNVSHQIQLLQITRKNMQNLIGAYSIDQLNKIPEGFKNNLVWNYGHVVATQQLLVYGLSGLTLHMENEFVEKYRKGSKPESKVGKAEFAYLNKLFNELPNTTLIDYNKGNFEMYRTYETSFGVTLKNVEDGILFNNMHEAMHLGTMLAIRKFI